MLYQKVFEASQKGERAALCYLTALSGGGPVKPGVFMLVYSDGRFEGTVGGGMLEKEALEETLNLLNVNTSGAFHLEDAGGRSADFFVKVLSPSYRLVVFGAGHVGQEVARLASQLGFETWLCDQRAEWLEKSNAGIRKIQLSENMEAFIPEDASIPCCFFITTHSHQLDFEILSRLIQKPFVYLGMIAGRQKVQKAKDYLMEKGIFDAAAWDKLDSPAGIDINAQNPAEIAVSVLARIIQIKNQL